MNHLPIGRISVALLSIVMLAAAAHAAEPIRDRIDYPFVDDARLRGNWKTVDYVKTVADFVPGQPKTPDLFILGVWVQRGGNCTYFSKDGQYNCKWTKGLFIDDRDYTAGAASVKQIGGKEYLFMEWKTADYFVLRQKPSLYVFERAATPPYEVPAYDPGTYQMWQVDLRGKDLSGTDLTARVKDLVFADFDTQTAWPAKMPAGFDPQRTMQNGRNPGLGVRALHEKGITGKGVGIAIIDQKLLLNHVEYKDRLRRYEEIHLPVNQREATMHGAAVASIAVGKTVGVAPEADLYYIAEQHGDFDSAGGNFVFDFTWLAKSVNRMLEVNRSLPAGKKIRVIAMQIGWDPRQKGYKEIMTAVKRAKAEGVFVVSSSLRETFGLSFNGLGRDPLSDPERATSYGPGMFWEKEYYANPAKRLAKNTLLIPMDSRCTASQEGPNDYVFYRDGGWSWSIPYIAGLYALACQVKPDVTPELFWKTALETGATNQLEKNGKKYNLGKIVQPERLMEKLGTAHK